MPALEAPSNIDDESSPENSIGPEFIGGAFGNGNAQLRARSPEPANAVEGALPIRTNNNFGALRLPTIRLQNQRIYIEPPPEPQQNEQMPVLHLPNNGSWLRITPAPPPVVNLLPVNLPPQITEPQLDELLRRVTQRNDLHNVETVRLRVISAITVSLSRLSLFLPRLQHLDLSGSVLNSLRDLGCGLVHLNHLNVSNCGLNSFDGTSGMPAVRILIADGNMIQRVGPLSQLPLLQRLSARSNRITDLGLLGFLGMCPNLTDVDLQGNPVCHLTLYRVTLLRSVRTLEVLDGARVSNDFSNPQQPSSPAATGASTSASALLAGHVEDYSERLEAERVAALNRRNVMERALSTASSSSTNSSSSSNQVNNLTNSEELSSLSSNESSAEVQQDATTISRVGISGNPSSATCLNNSSHDSNLNRSESATFAPAPTFSSLSSSLINIRRLRRPATAPTESQSRDFPDFAVAQQRPASAIITTMDQPRPSNNLALVSTSNIITSVLDLARQRRQQQRRQRYHGNAWASQSINSPPYEADSLTSGAVETSNTFSPTSPPSSLSSSSSSSSSVFFSASNSPKLSTQLNNDPAHQ